MTNTKTVTLADICKSLKVAPKTARRRLRGASNVPALIKDTRWTFNAKDAAKVKAIIKPAA